VRLPTGLFARWLAVEQLDDVIGAVRTDAGVARRSGARDRRTVFTVDDDFRSYRLSNRRYLDVVPTTTTRYDAGRSG